MSKIVNADTSPVLHQEKTSFGKYDEYGRFLPDARQMEAALSIAPGPTLIEQMRDMIRGENLAKAARDSGTETFDEANDFFVEDDPDSLVYSPYELDEDDALEARLAAARAGLNPDEVLARVSEVSPPAAPLGPSKKARKGRDPAPGDDERHGSDVDEGTLT
ncbi:MAG: hypothetical protein [Microvirus sp.]|nr:MAG: hypothetical protein [Microvirus sp.]